MNSADAFSIGFAGFWGVLAFVSYIFLGASPIG